MNCYIPPEIWTLIFYWKRIFFELEVKEYIDTNFDYSLVKSNELWTNFPIRLRCIYAHYTFNILKMYPSSRLPKYLGKYVFSFINPKFIKDCPHYTPKWNDNSSKIKALL